MNDLMKAWREIDDKITREIAIPHDLMEHATDRMVDAWTEGAVSTVELLFHIANQIERD